MVNDGLASVEVKATTFSGTNAQFGASEIGAAELADSAASGAKVDSTFATVGTGSPPSYGLSVLTGSAATGAGSDTYVVFGTPFASVPHVVATAGNNADTNITMSIDNGSTTIGSFYVVSHGAASAEFNWLAIGSGRI